jgi:hypothetical protein
MDGIAFACIDCDVWVGTNPTQAQAHTDEVTADLTQADFDAGADTHDGFCVVNTTEGA